MKAFRKAVGMVLVICMVAGLVGCKKNKNKEDQNQNNQTTVTQGVTSGNNSNNTSGNNQGNDNSSNSTTSDNQVTAAPTQAPVSGGVSTLGTGSKTGNFDLTGVSKVPADGIGTPGVDFEDIPAGEVRGWDDFDVVPAFNPLGDRDLYSDVYTDYYREDTIKYLADDGYTPASVTVNGY